jgi:hypothetical protein
LLVRLVVESAVIFSETGLSFDTLRLLTARTSKLGAPAFASGVDRFARIGDQDIDEDENQS